MVNAWMQTVKKVRDEMPKGTSLKEILVAAKKVYKKPAGLVKKAVKLFKNHKNVKILWASTREVFNYHQAKKCGCHIITMGPKFIEKLKAKKLSLHNYSVDTVKQFYIDGKKSKFKI